MSELTAEERAEVIRAIKEQHPGAGPGAVDAPYCHDFSTVSIPDGFIYFGQLTSASGQTVANTFQSLMGSSTSANSAFAHFVDLQRKVSIPDGFIYFGQQSWSITPSIT